MRNQILLFLNLSNISMQAEENVHGELKRARENKKISNMASDDLHLVTFVPTHLVRSGANAAKLPRLARLRCTSQNENLKFRLVQTCTMDVFHFLLNGRPLSPAIVRRLFTSNECFTSRKWSAMGACSASHRM